MATGLENLKTYQRAKDLTLRVHRATSAFPREERFRSVDQLKRSSAAVTNNIAEAYYKSSTKDKIHILRDTVIAEAEETRSNISMCAAKGFIAEKEVSAIVAGYTDPKKAVHGLIRFLREHPYAFHR